MLRTILAAFAAGAVIVAASATMAADIYAIDSGHTIPTFAINHMGFSIQHGGFARAAGSVTLDRAAKTGTVDVTIDAGTVYSGNAARDAVLKSDEFFNVAKFPTITFKSNDVVFEGDAVVGVRGELTILGVTKPVTLKVTNFKCGPNPFNKRPMCGAEAAATIRRSEFGMKYLLPAIGDDVTIVIPIEAAQA
jgi:polyisoprenoid-binding protein YceI